MPAPNVFIVCSLIHLHTKSVLQKGLLKDTLLILIMALISFGFCFSLHVTHSFVYGVNIYGTSITCEILDSEFVNKDTEDLSDLYVRVNFMYVVLKMKKENPSTYLSHEK